MGDLSPGAVEHAYPVMQVLLLFLAGLMTIIGGFWGGFRWLRTVINDEFTKLISAFLAANDRRHEAHDRAIEEMRERDNERADAIKRLHGRVDGILERLAP